MNLKLVSVLSIVGLMACGDSASSTGGSDTGGGGNGGDGAQGGGGEGGMGLEGPGGLGPGGNGGGGGEPDCYDDGAAAGLVALTAVAGQDLCTAAQIDDFLADCIDAATATEATCTAYQMANGPCSTCMGFAPEGSPAPTIHPALLPAGDYIFVNTIACEAVVQNKLDCAQSAADLQFCVFNTCGTCEQMTELPDCLGYSEADICGEQFVVTEDCGTLFPADGMEAPECAGADFPALLENVGNFLCGPPAP